MSKKIAEWPWGLLNDVVLGGNYDQLHPNLPADLPLAVQYLVDFTLSKREAKVVTSYYKDGLMHKQIGHLLGVSTERVRQIKVKAIRKLRHPARFIYIREGLHGGMAYFHECKYKQGYSEGYKVGYADAKTETPQADRLKDYCTSIPPAMMPGSIYELGLGVRTFNALKRAKISTIEELLELTPEDFRRIRNIGEKTATEIQTALMLHGYEPTCGSSE